MTKLGALFGDRAIGYFEFPVRFSEVGNADFFASLIAFEDDSLTRQVPDDYLANNAFSKRFEILPLEASLDEDSISPELDNCPLTDNEDQFDTDRDGIGDACDDDLDNDYVPNALESEDAGSPEDADFDGVQNKSDNCPTLANINQVDLDGDGIGDLCDLDDDNDGVLDENDRFPRDPFEQYDTDGDGAGNAADDDDDNDGVLDSNDAFPLDAGEFLDTDLDGIGNNADSDDDGDGILDAQDGFPLLAIGDRPDFDADGIPDDCDDSCTTAGFSEDLDDDNDGVPDQEDAFQLDSTESVDLDDDGIGDNRDDDDDGDGVPDAEDGFPRISLAGRLDTDEDGFPDECDEACVATGMLADVDDDNDGVTDDVDAFPLDATESSDRDGDGVGDNADAFPDDASEVVDDDADGVGSAGDNCPSVSNSDQLDYDGDGLGDACDDDDDNDGFTDEEELAAGTNPRNPSNCIQNCFTFDIDDSGEVQALSDGLLVIRYLFGFADESLISGAVSPSSERADSTEISSYLDDALLELDIDGNGEAQALSDGLLLIRYLFGFTEDALTVGAVGDGATRVTADEISAYIEERSATD